MVSIVIANHIKDHVSTRGLKGRSSGREASMKGALPDMIGWGAVHDRLGRRTMLRDPAGGQILAND